MREVHGGELGVNRELMVLDLEKYRRLAQEQSEPKKRRLLSKESRELLEVILISLLAYSPIGFALSVLAAWFVS